VKCPGLEVDNSTIFSAKDKNEWSYTSTAPLCLHVVNRNNFDFLFFFVILLHALYTCFDVLFLLIFFVRRVITVSLLPLFLY